jgi:hypothetical protein
MAQHHTMNRAAASGGAHHRVRLPKLQSPLASSVTSADIEAIHSDVGSQYPYAANDILEIVRKMYNWGKVAGYVSKDIENPVRGIVRFRERKRRRFLTTVEMPSFVGALEQEESEYARHGLWMLLLTGLRCAELLKAKWGSTGLEGSSTRSDHSAERPTRSLPPR